MKKLIFILSTLAIIACSTQNSIESSNTNFVLKKITIVNNTSRSPQILLNDDNFVRKTVMFEKGNQITLDNQKPTLISLISNRGDMSLSLFWVKPGDSLQMLEKNKDIVFVPYNQNAIRNKELDFVNAFARKYGYMPFRFGRGFRDTASITKDYKTGIDFLQSYSLAHKLSKEFTEASKKTLYYEKLSNIIESSRMSKSKLSGSFFKNFQCDECLKLGVSNYIGAFYTFAAFNKWTQTQAFDFAEKNYTGLSKNDFTTQYYFSSNGFFVRFFEIARTIQKNSYRHCLYQFTKLSGSFS